MSDLVTPRIIKDIYSRAKCLHSAQDIHHALSQMASQIHRDLEDENPLVLCVLIGGVVLTGKLLTLIDFPLQVDYIHASRYGNKTKGCELEWVVKPRASLAGRTILLID